MATASKMTCTVDAHVATDRSVHSLDLEVQTAFISHTASTLTEIQLLFAEQETYDPMNGTLWVTYSTPAPNS